jgi:hypothetical protein
MTTKFNTDTNNYDIYTNSPNDVDPTLLTRLKELFGNLSSFTKAHPYQALGTGANAAGNVAGLFDNDKILGQAVGTGLGLAAPKLLSMVPGPIGAFGKGLGLLGKANFAMGGGNLGALFDSLRAKQEQEQMAAQQYYGGY